jgi:hypothetical protein
LDTTVDTGPRTIGFKLVDPSGDLVVRYGRTPLGNQRWYHVAGVFDASSRRLDVYLDGLQDNGCLYGTVPGSQHPAATARIGSRPARAGYEFSGAIDNVRIYSRALTPSEIRSDMERDVDSSRVVRQVVGQSDRNAGPDATCAVVETSRERDVWTLASTVVFGLLLTVVWVAYWPARTPWIGVAASGASGFVLLATAASNLPSFDKWMVPLLAIAGGASAAVSMRSQHRRTS